MADDMGLIADTAITALGVEAKHIEDIAFAMPDTPHRAQLVEIVEGLRDLEAKLRLRIGALARGA